MQSITPVILCGGSGTRLWPLSRELYPKQFVDLGDGRTLFGDTLDRVRCLGQPPLHASLQAPLVVCNEAHRFYVTAALHDGDLGGRIILEPEPRNTAPAVALAALALEGLGDALMLVMPSDHTIQDHLAFADGVWHGAALAEQGHIVTFGIAPTGPETGFGYIEQGAALGDHGYGVTRFVEKPDADKAAAMLARGGFFWNSGIFLLRASVFLAELERHAPEMATACRKAWSAHTEDALHFLRPDTEAFRACPADSIDYAVMERTALAAVVPLHTTWSDLGSWEAFYQAGTADGNGNVSKGDVLLDDVRNCYCNARHRLLAAIGVHDLAIIETQDAVLVAPRTRAQDVKGIVTRLKQAQRTECEQHPLVYRPWGSYETLAMGPRFQVKRIIVNPKQELSLQMHYHRAEHWVIVSGTAEITNGEHTCTYTENQSTYIPVGVKHRLKNPGTIPLVLIEVQSGSYLGEDDIVRFEDMYNR